MKPFGAAAGDCGLGATGFGPEVGAWPWIGCWPILTGWPKLWKPPRWNIVIEMSVPRAADWFKGISKLGRYFFSSNAFSVAGNWLIPSAAANWTIP